MIRRFIVLALCAGLSVPALAVGFDKLGVFRSIDLDEGEWATTLTIDDVIVTRAETETPDADVNAKIEEILTQKGRVQDTTDCIGNKLSANGDLILPGVAFAAECTITDRSVSSDGFAITVVCGEEYKSTTTFEAAKTKSTIDGTVNMLIQSRSFTTELRVSTTSRLAGACKTR